MKINKVRNYVCLSLILQSFCNFFVNFTNFVKLLKFFGFFFHLFSKKKKNPQQNNKILCIAPSYVNVIKRSCTLSCENHKGATHLALWDKEHQLVLQEPQ